MRFKIKTDENPPREVADDRVQSGHDALRVDEQEVAGVAEPIQELRQCVWWSAGRSSRSIPIFNVGIYLLLISCPVWTPFACPFNPTSSALSMTR